MTFSLFASLLALIVITLVLYAAIAMFLTRYNLKRASETQLAVFNEMMNDEDEHDKNDNINRFTD